LQPKNGVCQLAPLSGRALAHRRGGYQGGPEGSGYTYVSADAQGDPQKQPSDIEGLIAQGCTALIVLAQDSKAPFRRSSRRKRHIPVIAYDALLI
jgi:D-xylose transport system substrate-binding protein